VKLLLEFSYCDNERPSYFVQVSAKYSDQVAMNLASVSNSVWLNENLDICFLQHPACCRLCSSNREKPVLTIWNI